MHCPPFGPMEIWYASNDPYLTSEAADAVKRVQITGIQPERFRLRATFAWDGKPDVPYYLGHQEGQFEGADGVVSIVPADAPGATIFELTKLELAPLIYEFQVENYGAPPGAETPGERPYLYALDKGEMMVRFLPEDHVTDRAKFICRAPRAGVDGAAVSLESLRFRPGNFLRHQGFRGYLSDPEDADRYFDGDATWVIEPVE